MARHSACPAASAAVWSPARSRSEMRVRRPRRHDVQALGEALARLGLSIGVALGEAECVIERLQRRPLVAALHALDAELGIAPPHSAAQLAHLM